MSNTTDDSEQLLGLPGFYRKLGISPSEENVCSGSGKWKA